jgi:heat-inducible transcriptional repressor
MEEISTRKEQILKAVVIEYVATAEPVGSQLLGERYPMGIGPATIRSEMAEMSERGLLEQPHTSAGRIPSDSGYRYYVERLAEPIESKIADREVRTVVRSDMDLDDLLRETCAVLTKLTRYASIATTVSNRSVTVRQVTLAGVTPTRVVMLVLLSTGEVEKIILEASADLTLSNLYEISAALSAHVANKTIKQIARTSAPEFTSGNQPAVEMMTRAWRALRSACKERSLGKIVREGTTYLLAEPEFQRNIAALTDLVRAIEDADTMHQVLDRTPGSRANVTIGKEHEPEPLKHVAIIASRFFVHNEEAGAIAVLGPTRMRYEQTIPIVEHAARALSDAITKLVS